MAEQSTDPDSRSNRSRGTDRAATSGTPRWVKVFGVVGLIVVGLIVFMVVAGSGGAGGEGQHGPGRHAPGSDVGAPTGEVTENQAPPGGSHTPLSGGSG